MPIAPPIGPALMGMFSAPAIGFVNPFGWGAAAIPDIADGMVRPACFMGMLSAGMGLRILLVSTFRVFL